VPPGQRLRGHVQGLDVRAPEKANQCYRTTDYDKWSLVTIYPKACTVAFRRASHLEGTLSGRLSEGRSEMLRADLLKPDLLSEIVLLGSGALLFSSLLLIVVIVLAQA
jgi:hypothetical protein